MRASGYIRIDETPLQALKSETNSTQQWMWVRVAGPPGQRLILFDHDPSRSAQVAARLLEGACGYVQSDGYAAYDAVAAASQLTHVGCFAQYPASGFIWSKDPMSLQQGFFPTSAYSGDRER